MKTRKSNQRLILPLNSHLQLFSGNVKSLARRSHLVTAFCSSGDRGSQYTFGARHKEKPCRSVLVPYPDIPVRPSRPSSDHDSSRPPSIPRCWDSYPRLDPLPTSVASPRNQGGRAQAKVTESNPTARGHTLPSRLQKYRSACLRTLHERARPLPTGRTRGVRRGRGGAKRDHLCLRQG
jgi:hypothetical protein